MGTYMIFILITRDYPNDEEHFVVCSSSCYGSERRLANCALVRQNCSSCIDNYPVHITCCKYIYYT